MAKKHCPHCGASMVEYKRGFSKDMARCIYRLANAGGYGVDVATLGLTNPQYSNFQRLRFWGLACKNEGSDDGGKGGVWTMTTKGWAFVKGELPIPRYAFTYRGHVVDYSDETVMIQDVTEGWWYKPRVIAESKPHSEPTALSLF